MTKIDIFSGFLGAGKTTLIKKLIKEAYGGEKLVLIENEFGEIGVDGGFLQEAGITVNELNSGCICCSLVGDFSKALKQVYEQYSPDRILIEPSGVGKLSDVIAAVQNAKLPNCKINAATAVVDATKCKTYMKNFGEFFNDQIRTASCIVFSHVDVSSQDKLNVALGLVRAENPQATVVTTAWNQLSGKDILGAMEKTDTLEASLKALECEHEHHRHDHGECEHEHHHHHHADEVFNSWGVETGKKFTEEQIKNCLSKLSNAVQYGTILRAKGIVAAEDGGFIHFDYVPGEADVRRGASAYTGRLCVIGSKIDEEELQELFGV